jgi:hypothetical protein
VVTTTSDLRIMAIWDCCWHCRLLTCFGFLIYHHEVGPATLVGSCGDVRYMRRPVDCRRVATETTMGLVDNAAYHPLPSLERPVGLETSRMKWHPSSTSQECVLMNDAGFPFEELTCRYPWLRATHMRCVVRSVGWRS